MLSSGSRRSLLSAFQTVGPITANARRPYVLSCILGTTSRWRLAERRCCRSVTGVHSSHRDMALNTVSQLSFLLQAMSTTQPHCNTYHFPHWHCCYTTPNQRQCECDDLYSALFFYFNVDYECCAVVCAGQEGDDDAAMMNGDIVSTASNDAGQIRRQDIVTVTGKQDDCDAACAALRVCTNNSLTSSSLFSNVASCRHLYQNIKRFLIPNYK